MDTTYLVGLFVPKDVKEGQWIDYNKRVVAVKVTMLQKEMLKASSSTRHSFIDSALEVLKEAEPEMASSLKRTHHFWIVDPEQRLGKSFESSVREWERHGCHDYPTIDLTDEKILGRH